MVNEEHAPRVLSDLVVPPSGALKTTGDPFEPYRLVDGAGGDDKAGGGTRPQKRPVIWMISAQFS